MFLDIVTNPPQCLVWLPLMHRLANVEHGTHTHVYIYTIFKYLYYQYSSIFTFSLSLSLSSRVVLLLSWQRHDGLPLPLPPLPRLPAVSELLLARQRQRLTQQPAPDEGALVLGESLCRYSFVTPGGTISVCVRVKVFTDQLKILFVSNIQQET